MMSLFCKLPNETKDKMFKKVNIKEMLKKFTKTRLLNLNKIKDELQKEEKKILSKKNII